MEKQEFLDLIVQLLPAQPAGEKTRLTLVRTFDSFFPKKLTNERYLRMKIIPIMQHYKVVLSTFNQREYKRFKTDFRGDISFLAFTHHDMEGLLSVANASHFYLTAFQSSGKGQIKLKSTADITGQNYLFNEIRNAVINEILPYSLTFSNGKSALELRTDFNLILAKPDGPTLSFVYDFFDHMLGEKDVTMNRIATTLIPHSGRRNNKHLDPILYECTSDLSPETILRSASSGFIPGRLESSILGHAFYIFNENYKTPFCRITVHGRSIKLIATPGSSIDNLILVMNNLSGIGRMVNEVTH